ncbi:MAG: transposase, partial [Pirellulales bacterium]
EFWSDGYFASTVGKHGSESTISQYVKKQGGSYSKLHEDRQNTLF